MKTYQRAALRLTGVLATIALLLPALATAQPPCPGNSCAAPGLQKKLTHGGTDLKGNLKTSRHIYYEGDPLAISLQFARGSELLADGSVEAHIVVISPEVSIAAFPVANDIGTEERMFFAVEFVDPVVLPPGQYQLALVATFPGGDPLNLADWYNGFRGLLDLEGVLITTEPVLQDVDMNGECDFDADGDGFCDVENEQDDDDEVDDDIPASLPVDLPAQN